MTFVHKALKKSASTLETKYIIYNSEKDLVLVSLLNVKLRMAKTKKQLFTKILHYVNNPQPFIPNRHRCFVQSLLLVLYCIALFGPVSNLAMRYLLFSISFVVLGLFNLRLSFIRVNFDPELDEDGSPMRMARPNLCLRSSSSTPRACLHQEHIHQYAP